MNAKENYLALLNHETTEWVPIDMVDMVGCGNMFESFENGPLGGGVDGFGVNWVVTDSAGGMPSPDPTQTLLADVCDWEDVVEFPDLDAFDWQGLADMQLAGVNRDEQAIEYNTWNSVFMRFTHLLGFENGLMAFYLEPDASRALCDAIADYKIRVLERAYEYFKPDVFVHFDDVATERSLFMSPDTYREFIKPGHTKISKACRELGIIPAIHVCGYCTDIIEDLIEEGNAAWKSAQPCNDLDHIIKTYGDRLAVIGGYDTQGAPGFSDATHEQIITEVDRCMETYGHYDTGFGFMGFILGDFTAPEIVERTGVLLGRASEMGRKVKGVA